MGAPLEPGGALVNRRARRRSRLPMSEINVTPMVDVMLVLLIIFMVTAPLLTMGTDTGLTVSATGMDEGPLSITVDAEGKIFLQDSEISSGDLVPKLTAIREAFGANQVRIRADKATSYGNLAAVLVRLKEAGFQVTLITDQVD